jgi:hypothetical protein
MIRTLNHERDVSQALVRAAERLSRSSPDRRSWRLDHRRDAKASVPSVHKAVHKTPGKHTLEGKTELQYRPNQDSDDLRPCSSNEPRHIVLCVRARLSPNQIMGAGKIKFEHLRKTKDLARTSRDNQDGNTPFLKPNRNQGPRPARPEGRINRSFSSHTTTGPHPVASSSKLYPPAGRPTLKPRIHLRKATNNLKSRSFLAYRSIFFPNEGAGRGAYLSFLSQSAFFFRKALRRRCL